MTIHIISRTSDIDGIIHPIGEMTYVFERNSGISPGKGTFMNCSKDLSFVYARPEFDILASLGPWFLEPTAPNDMSWDSTEPCAPGVPTRTEQPFGSGESHDD